MKLNFISKFRSWLNNDSGVDQSFSEVELLVSKIEEQKSSIKCLKVEGTLTTARLDCMMFRATKAINQYEEQTKIPLVRYKRLAVVLFIIQVALFALLWQIGANTILLLFVFSVVASPSVFHKMVDMGIICVRPRKSAIASNRIRTAEFLLWLLLPREGREAAIGDTNEKFQMMLERNDKPWKAHVFLWSEVAKSAWPLLCYLGKQLCKWCGFGALAEFLRRAL